MNTSATLSYLADLKNKDVFALLGDLNNAIVGWAEKLKLDAWILLAAGALLALAIGLWGYKLIKPTLALLMGGFGYVAGMELYALIAEKNANLDSWVKFAVAGGVALVFLVLSCIRPRISLFVLAAVLGYCAVLYYAKGNMVLSCAGAIVLGFVAIRFSRFFYMTFTSMLGGFALVSFANELIAVLLKKQLSNILLVIGISAGIGVLFLLSQALSNKRKHWRI